MSLWDPSSFFLFLRTRTLFLRKKSHLLLLPLFSLFESPVSLPIVPPLFSSKIYVLRYFFSQEVLISPSFSPLLLLRRKRELS